jgi:ATP-dependent DNA ligase
MMLAIIGRRRGGEDEDFHALRNRRRVREVVLYAFDLIRHDGEDLRNLPLIDRKRRLASYRPIKRRDPVR